MTTTKQIYIASDHAGFELKGFLKEKLSSMEYEVIDYGPDMLIPQDDYPDYISKVAKIVSESKGIARAIIIGGSGQGEAMVANKYKYVRADVYYGGNIEIVKLGREHNDANVISLGARFMTNDQAFDAVSIWLDTPFSNDERHVRRIHKMDELR